MFAVRDLKLKRELAIKVLRPDLVVTANLLARFRREAEAVAALQHPHIVPLHSAGEGDGLLYYTMPLVEGESVRQRIDRLGPRPLPEVVRLLLSHSLWTMPARLSPNPLAT